jgi:hypothetical protein
VRRVMWIRHLTQNLGVNLAGVRILFELEERLGTRILERLSSEGATADRPERPSSQSSQQPDSPEASGTAKPQTPQAAAASAAKP